MAAQLSRRTIVAPGPKIDLAFIVDAEFHVVDKTAIAT